MYILLQGVISAVETTSLRCDDPPDKTFKSREGKARVKKTRKTNSASTDCSEMKGRRRVAKRGGDELLLLAPNSWISPRRSSSSRQWKSIPASGHSAHVGQTNDRTRRAYFRASSISLTMRRDLLFNVDHVYGIAGLFIKELMYISQATSQRQSGMARLKSRRAFASKKMCSVVLVNFLSFFNLSPLSFAWNFIPD